MNLTGFALRNQPLVLIIVFALVAYSVTISRRLPEPGRSADHGARSRGRDLRCPAWSPEDVELLVTRTIEQALARIPERDYIYSWSRNGRSEVRIKVLDRYEQDDLDIIWQDVRNKVIDATPSFPTGAYSAPS